MSGRPGAILPCVVWALLGSGIGAGEEKAGLDWWSWQPIERPAATDVDGGGRHPIDLLVRARLAEAGMEAAPEADPRTLVRRLYFDLVGIPPTFEEVEAYAASPSKESYGHLVDHLLASPHFGERWARHWLDVVRYAETNGYERDAVKPNIWKYRDWVIDAFNNDMPYDQFVREQIAGDELPGHGESALVATGMLRAGTWNDEPNDPQEYKYERLEDMVDVVTTSFLGLTVKCARCHDHKFDPIPQRDYYRLAGAFWAGPIEPRERELMGGPNEEELGAAGVFGWTDLRRDPPPLHLLINGDAHRAGPVVEPGVLSLIPGLDGPMPGRAEDRKTSGRRLQLADYIVDERNPLTARVMVNRIWQHLLGEGIVRTPNNFGLKGAVPTHPELLDWLAAEFRDDGWRVKKLVRQIVLSRTYRQCSVHPRELEYAGKDPGNELLWRGNRRRLDAEALRDSLLAVSGELNRKGGGPGFYPVMSSEVLEGFSRKGSAWTPSGAEERLRRSIYMVSKRHLLLPLMTAFDFPNSERPCGRRDVTTVATQALAMMNNEFVHERSEALANAIGASAADDREALQLAWRRVLKRSPTQAELEIAERHFVKQLAHFRARREAPESEEPQSEVPDAQPVLWLRADRGVESEEGAVVRWEDLSGSGHHAVQAMVTRRPKLIETEPGRKALQFDGGGAFLELAGQVVTGQEHTVLAVASDRTKGTAHRGIFSNWNGEGGNSTTSVFLGLTGEGTVRFSDDFRSSESVRDRDGLFVLGATTTAGETRITCNGATIGVRPAGLARRELAPPYVIGQQGNINGEYWQGEIAEVLVYDRGMNAAELRAVSEVLASRHGIELQGDREGGVTTPELLALASVCHVLMNSNEFLHVD